MVDYSKWKDIEVSLFDPQFFFILIFDRLRLCLRKLFLKKKNSLFTLTDL